MLNKEMVFKKEVNGKTLELHLKDFKLSDRDLKFSYKVVGADNNEEFSRGGTIHSNNQIIFFKKVVINKKKYSGMTTSVEFINELKKIKETLLDKRNIIDDEIIEKLVSGQEPITFKLIGYSDVEYSPSVEWAENDAKYKDLEFNDYWRILEKAYCILMQEKYSPSNVHKAISKRLNLYISNVEEVNTKYPNAKDCIVGKKATENWDYDNIVTSFSITMPEALHAKEYIAKKEEREAKRKAIFDKAKETGEKQLITSYISECNDSKEECSLDINYLYAMPDGTEKLETCHTW